MSADRVEPAATVDADPRSQHIVRYFETLTPASLTQIAAVYADGARFIDPFDDVSGLPAIRRVFEHMFQNLHAPRFEVLRCFSDGDECMLLWNFRFRRGGRTEDTVIHGVSHLRYGADGRIEFHQDHWDPARQIYEGLPVLGRVLRWLRRSLSAQA